MTCDLFRLAKFQQKWIRTRTSQLATCDRTSQVILCYIMSDSDCCMNFCPSLSSTLPDDAKETIKVKFIYSEKATNFFISNKIRKFCKRKDILLATS